MSDELIFDSERMEKKAQRKRLLIPLLVLAGILLAAAAVVLIVRLTKGVVHRGGEDSPFPYAWRVSSDGTMTLELSHESAPDFRWALEGDEELGILIATRGEKDRDDTTKFTLTPNQPGRAIVDLALVKPLRSPDGKAPGVHEEDPDAELSEDGETGAPVPEAAEAKTKTNEKTDQPGREGSGDEECLYRYSFLVEYTADKDGKLRGDVRNVTGNGLQAAVSGGADTQNPYRIYAQQKHAVVAEVQIDPNEAEWDVEIRSGEASVSVDGIVRGSGSIRLLLSPGAAAGEAELVFRSEQANAELLLRCERLEEGTLLLKEHSIRCGEKPERSKPGGEASILGNLTETEASDETRTETEAETEVETEGETETAQTEADSQT